MTKKKASKKKSKASSKSSTSHHASRGLWSGNISFGLVTIPVRLVSAKEQEDLHFTMLDPSNLSPIGYKYYNKSSGREVKHNDTVKAYEYSPDRYVLMSDADFKKANPKATRSIDIENFVRLDEIDPVFFDRAYYLVPQEGGEKAYALLAQALHEAHKVGIAKIVLHTKQHLAALVPRGQHLLLELLHFAEDVKELRELDDKEVHAPKLQSREVNMAERLIDDMSERWNPDAYKDTYRADILKRVKAKIRAGKATEITEETVEPAEEESTNVVDLLPLLRKSLQSKKTRARSRTSHTRH